MSQPPADQYTAQYTAMPRMMVAQPMPAATPAAIAAAAALHRAQYGGGSAPAGGIGAHGAAGAAPFNGVPLMYGVQSPQQPQMQYQAQPLMHAQHGAYPVRIR